MINLIKFLTYMCLAITCFINIQNIIKINNIYNQNLITFVRKRDYFYYEYI